MCVCIYIQYTITVYCYYDSDIIYFYSLSLFYAVFKNRHWQHPWLIIVLYTSIVYNIIIKTVHISSGLCSNTKSQYADFSFFIGWILKVSNKMRLSHFFTIFCQKIYSNKYFFRNFLAFVAFILLLVWSLGESGN